MSIESVVLDSIKHLNDKNFDAAMTDACISLDATAKEEFELNVGNRYKKFIKANLDILTYIGTGGAIVCAPGSTLNLKSPEKPTECISFEDIIYKSIRNYLVHEAKLPTGVTFTEESFYGERDEKFYIPVLLIYAILLSVIVAPTNKPRKLGSDFVMQLFGEELHLENLWGKGDVLRKQLGLS